MRDVCRPLHKTEVIEMTDDTADNDSLQVDLDFSHSLGSNFQQLLMEDIANADPGKHVNGPFVSAYRNWINGTGPAVEDPSALLHASGVSPELRFGSMSAMMIREMFVAQIGYCAPTAAFVDAFKSMPTVLEVGAGRGYLSAILRQGGLDAIATDQDPLYMSANPYLTEYQDIPGIAGTLDIPVEALDAKAAIAKYPGRTLLCSWPSLDSDWIGQAALCLAPGQKIAVIGEGGDATGDDCMFDLVQSGALAKETDATICDASARAIWSFQSMHDIMRVYIRL